MHWPLYSSTIKPLLWKIRKELIALLQTVHDLGNREIYSNSNPGNCKGLHRQSCYSSLQHSINGGLINIRKGSKGESHQHTWKPTWCVWSPANYKLIQHRLHVQEKETLQSNCIVLDLYARKVPFYLASPPTHQDGLHLCTVCSHKRARSGQPLILDHC